MFRVRHNWSLLILASATVLTSAAARGVSAQESEEAELLRLNAALFRSQIVERDGQLLDQVAYPQFRVLAPGGLIENKAQAIAGVAAWNVDSIELSGEEVIREGPVAVVMGRLDIDGTMDPVGRWGPLKYMGVYIRSDGEWKFLSRSLTPCVEMLVRLGRC